MCNSLLLTQFIGLFKSTNFKSIYHADYWIGDVLTDLDDKLDHFDHPGCVIVYFVHIKGLIFEGRNNDYLTPGSWRALMNKTAYTEQMKSLPTPRVELMANSQYNYKNVWKRLNRSLMSIMTYLSITLTSSYNMSCLSKHRVGGWNITCTCITNFNKFIFLEGEREIRITSI